MPSLIRLRPRAQQSYYWACTAEKIIIQKDTCTPVSTAALFTISRTWKQPLCQSTDEWIKKFCYIYAQWNITQPLKRMKLGYFSDVDGPRVCHTE